MARTARTVHLRHEGIGITLTHTLRIRIPVYGKRFLIIGEYRGSHECIRVRCKPHRREFSSSPTNLISGVIKHGCGECLKAAGFPFNRLTPDGYVKRISEKYDGGIIVDVDTYRGLDEEVRARCVEHGDFRALGRTILFDSDYGCPICGKVRVGYTPQRLRSIERGIVKKLRPTTIALMKIEVFGITAYKWGTTSRSLSSRYKEAIKEILFEAVLDEQLAVRLELELHGKYHALCDHRVRDTARRSGEKWAGVSELYQRKAVPLILKELRAATRKKVTGR